MNKGFVLPPLAYLIAAAVAIAALTGLYIKVRHDGYAAAESEYKPKLVAAQQEIGTLGAQIKVQNDAVAALKAESDARMAKAKQALAKAATEAQGARTEAERLRVATRPENAPSASVACPAGEAVKVIRAGLK